MTLDSNCCEDFLLFRHSQDVKNSFCLCFSIFLLCKQLLLNIFRSFHLLNPKYSQKHFQDRAPFQTKQKKTRDVILVSVLLQIMGSEQSQRAQHSHHCIKWHRQYSQVFYAIKVGLVFSCIGPLDLKCSYTSQQFSFSHLYLVAQSGNWTVSIEQFVKSLNFP